MIDRKAVRDLLAAGKTNSQIATLLGCKADTIGKIRRTEFADLSVDPPDAPPDPDPDGMGPNPLGLFDTVEGIEDADDVLDEMSIEGGGASSVIDSAKERAATALLEVQEKKAALENAKLDRELQAMIGPEPMPAPPPGGYDITQILLQQNQAMQAEMRQQAAAHQQLMMQLLVKQQAQPAPASPVGLKELIGLVTGIAPALKSVLEVVDDLRGGSEPANPMSQLLSLAGKQLEARNQAIARGAPPPGAVPPAVPAQTAATPPPAEQPPPAPVDPEAEGKARASNWFAHVQRELAIRSDANAVAEVLHGELGALPQPVREAILTQEMVEMEATLRQYLPPQQADDFLGQILASDANAMWLGELLLALREIELEPEQPEEVPQNGVVHAEPAPAAGS